MIEMLILWVVIPILLVLLCYGIGLTFSLLVGKPMSFALATVFGFLLMAVLGSLTTLSATIAPYTAFFFVVISVFGVVVSAIWFRSHIQLDYLPGLSGLLTYIGFSLPVAAYGNPSWAGWVKLDDTGTWFAITDRLMSVGQSVPSTVTSTFDRVISVYLGGNQFNYGGVNNGHFNYPVGSFIPFGVISKLTGVEKAWVFQPYLALIAGLGAMIFVLILRVHLSNKALLVAISTISMMASTIYSYVMWGGIKEITLIVPIVLFSYAFFKALDNNSSKEYFLYAFVALLGLFSIGGKTSLGFAVPILFVGILIKAQKRSRTILYAIVGTTSVAVLAVLYTLQAGNNAITKFFVPVIPDSGNLARPLNLSQIMGIWPSQDFRADPINIPITIIVIALAILFAIYGVYACLRFRKWEVPTLLAAILSIVIYSRFYSGIWLTGKAIAVASPFLLLGALLGVYYAWSELNQSSRSFIQKWKIPYFIIVSAVLISSGALVSDSFTYKNVWLAPYSSMNELKTIGNLYAGEGPALMTEYSVFGARHFLRALDAEAASELRVHFIPMSDGNEVRPGLSADIGLFDPGTIDYFKLLVLRRSPVASRPPLNYHLVWSGVHYEVWKRSDGAPKIRAMLNIGNNYSPGLVPSCTAVTSFLSTRVKKDRIFAAVRDKTYVIDFAKGDLPRTWTPLGSGGAVDRSGSGGFSRQFSVDETRTYDLSLAGSYPGQLTLLVDGTQVFSGHSLFEGNATLTNTLTNVPLSAGSHVLTLIYERPLFMPGSDAVTSFGPVFLSSQMAGDVKVKQVSVSRIPQLCKQNLDWIAITN